MSCINKRGASNESYKNKCEVTLGRPASSSDVPVVTLGWSLPPQEDEVMPGKFEDDLIWVAADAPLSDSAFLSTKIKDLCGDLPIFWLRPAYSRSE